MSFQLGKRSDMMRDKCLNIDTSNGCVSDEQMQLCGMGSEAGRSCGRWVMNRATK